MQRARGGERKKRRVSQEGYANRLIRRVTSLFVSSHLYAQSIQRDDPPRKNVPDLSPIGFVDEACDPDVESKVQVVSNFSLSSRETVNENGRQRGELSLGLCKDRQGILVSEPGVNEEGSAISASCPDLFLKHRKLGGGGREACDERRES
jgi:hypothetical protein